MKIEKYNIQNTKPSFKGYDARKLCGLFVTDKNCAEALKKITAQSGIDIFVPNIASKSIKKEFYQLAQSNKLLWTQDYLTFLNHQTKAVLFDNSRDFLKRVLRACGDGLKKDLNYTPLKSQPHIRGGNFFVCRNNGKDELLILENREIYPQELAKKIFNVEKIHTIPKMDYHIDLFLRPLDNGNILVSDIDMTKTGLQNGAAKIKKYIEQNKPNDKERQELENVINNINLMIEKLDITLKFDKYKPQQTMPEIIKILKDAGYNPIRVPATYHYLDGVRTKENVQRRLNNFDNNVKALKDWSQSQSEKTRQSVDRLIQLETFKKNNDKNLGVELENFYENNFLNAIVHKKEDGKLVYITNESLLDKTLDITNEIEQKTGFSTKNMFIESMAPYINKENIYFIDEQLTQKLFKNMGGIHCAAAEMPFI